MMETTVARVRFEQDTIRVHVKRDPFGALELVANINARSLHPFCDRANHDWLFELVDFVSAYYALDRFTARPRNGWCRPFTIEYPVRADRVDVWRFNAPLIKEWLLALTGDIVDVVPMPWEGDALRYDHLVLQLDGKVDAVGLISDGLDSLCGLDVAARFDRNMAWASVFAGHKGKRIREMIGAVAPSHAHHHYHMTMDLANGNEDKEQTQRSRTVLAIVMGMTLAYALESPAVECYENGMGLLNLSIPDLQFSGMSSQVLNPSHLPLWDRVSRAFFEQTIELRFPNRFRTKGEMLKLLSQNALERIESSFSCDAEERVKDKGVLHCGTCGSCRVRQLALDSAGLVEYDADYAGVRRDPHVNTERLMRYHASLLAEALASGDPWRSLCRMQRELRNVPFSDERRVTHEASEYLRQKTMDLLRRHVLEIGRWTAISSVA